MATEQIHSKVRERFLNHLAVEISDGEYTVETWPSDFYSSIKEAINTIPHEKWRHVLYYRCQGWTQMEIGKALAITQSRVHQIEQKGTAKLIDILKGENEK